MYSDDRITEIAADVDGDADRIYEYGFRIPGDGGGDIWLSRISA